MPFRHTDKGWYWGSKGPFASKAKALQVARAAYASGYKEESIMEKSAVGEFIGTLLHSATITHFMHLKSKSYAEHKALRSYYDNVIDLVDTVAESIQGCYQELIEDYPTAFGNPAVEPLAYMLSLKEFVATMRDKLPQDSNIQNEVDNIVTLIDSTAYKLKFLK